MSSKSAILVPLYIYPLPGAWDPLYKAISSHRNVDFVIVVNPNSGPGTDWKPDASYTAEILKLNSQPNVRTVGYVRLDYCRRNLSHVEEDIQKYAGWPTNAEPGLGVQGVFFDETPNLHSPQVASYLDSVNRLVKASSGIGGSRLVIHNPGTIPHASLAAPGPDVTAVVEESYATYSSAHVQARLATLCRPHYLREKCCYIVHSVPPNLQTQLVEDLCQHGAYVYVTDRRKNYYEGFGEKWSEFVNAVDSRNVKIAA